jgi:hypothetical protein
MREAVSPTIKNFLILSSRDLDSSLVEEIQRSGDSRWKLLQAFDGTVLFAESRDGVESSTTLPIVCGENQDLNLDNAGFLGNGILIQETGSSGLRILSSLTGLPPLFLYQDSHFMVLANSIDSIARLSSCSMHFDIQSVLELVKIGQPINHRTLFNEIKIVPAGSQVTVAKGRLEVKEDVWQPQTGTVFNSSDDYLEAMVGAMQASITRLDLSSSFLSLTAGLDTRAILAILVIQDKLLPAFTISGSSPTLDAMRARQLSKAYGFPHKLVSIDQCVEDSLPEYTMLASRYSGGLNSIEQAIEICFFKLAAPGFTGRLSGNLGNQIGRSGTEGTSVRNAPTTSLGDFMDSYLNAWDERHWFFKANPDTDIISPHFIITRENLFAQLGNYCIGHEFVTQQTPYADGTVIDMKYREPASNREYTDSIKGIKRRDLKHRILGQSVNKSFQCRAVKKAGGFVADCPINWGWKVAGGYSPGGLYYGSKAFADIALGNRFDHIPGAEKILQFSGVKGFSSFHTRHILYTARMREYIRDLFHKTSTLECGLFNRQRLNELSGSKMTDESLYNELVATLDLAVAADNFGVSI